VDAFATPFVQGRLRGQDLSVRVDTSCAQSGRPMGITITSDLDYTVDDPDCRPMIFVPEVDFKNLKEPSIIDAF
jgi:hypothetical protein